MRVWIERDMPHGFRARITQMLDSASPERGLAAVANPDDVYAEVRSWVERFVNPN